MLPTQPEREGTSFSILPKIMLLRSALHSVHIEFFVCCFLNRLSFPFFARCFLWNQYVMTQMSLLLIYW